MAAASPRNFTAVGMVPGMAPPQQRAARMAARRVFVEAKQNFMQAVAHLDDGHGRWLQHQLRQAQEPVDLWLLRSEVFRALGTEPAGNGPGQRRELRRFLDSTFPRGHESSGHYSSGFSPL